MHSGLRKCQLICVTLTVQGMEGEGHLPPQTNDKQESPPIPGDPRRPPPCQTERHCERTFLGFARARLCKQGDVNVSLEKEPAKEVSVLPRDLWGPAAFVQIGFPASALPRLGCKSCPAQHQVCLRALHTPRCEDMLLKGFPVSVSSLAPRATWNSLEDAFGRHAHGRRLQPVLVRAWAGLPGPLAATSLPSPASCRCLWTPPLSSGPSLTVRAITSHTAFFGKPPF